jgi:hypothetical protein
LRFKTTQNIFKDLKEYFDENWMDSDTIILPPKTEWDYKRPMRIEDVNIWEVIYEQGGSVGVYAAYDPYAEFYMIRVGWFLEAQGYGAEVYYGQGAMKKVMQRMTELNIPYSTHSQFIEPDNMWLYQDPEPKSNISILP